MRSVLSSAMSMRSLAAVGAASTNGASVDQPDLQSSTFEYRCVRLTSSVVRIA